MTDRFDDDGGFAGTYSDLDSLLTFLPDVDEMPEVEDIAADTPVYFVGYFVLVKCALDIQHKRVSNSEYAPSFAVKLEGIFEEWIESAQDYLPEWAHDLID
jgi:hypothetical protein